MSFDERIAREVVARAPRYPVRLSVRYRYAHQRTWYEAETRNVSASGVLFERKDIDPSIAANAAIVMSLAMPPVIPGSPVIARLVCTGHIVRFAAGQPDAAASVAATIKRYRFERLEAEC